MKIEFFSKLLGDVKNVAFSLTDSIKLSLLFPEFDSFSGYYGIFSGPNFAFSAIAS